MTSKETHDAVRALKTVLTWVLGGVCGYFILAYLYSLYAGLVVMK
jgi:hypothetical protein